MDENKELARHVLYILCQCFGLLADSVWITKLHCTEDEFLKHRKAVGHVMGELLYELMRPIYLEYPDLDPLRPSTDADTKSSSSGAPPPAEAEDPAAQPDKPAPDDRKV